MRKLNLGCGSKAIPGWDNLDLQPGPGAIACDLTKGLPYADNSVDYIFSEHFIEHLTRPAAQLLLSECNRVLRPAGRIRFSTPDLRTMARDYLHARLDRWAPVAFVGTTPCEHLNAGMRDWGHTFVYDWTELELLFNQAGFRALERKVAGQSEIDALTGLETRPFVDDLIIEGQKRPETASPRVAVVMSSYNHERFVARAIDSVLNQSFQDFEFVISDDGSSDRTCDVIRGYVDPRIKFTPLGTNRGACYSLNSAIRRSSAPFIAIINSDDIFYPRKIERQLRLLEEDPSLGAVFTHVNVIDESDSPVTDYKNELGDFDQANRSRREWLARLYFGGNCLAHPSAMVRRDCYLIEGQYDERFRQLPDYLMWIRVLKRWNIHVIPEPLTGFRRLNEANNESAVRPEAQRRGLWETTQIAKEVLSFSDDDFRHIARLVLTDKADGLIASQPRELVFVEMALQLGSVAFIQAAIEMIYESFPRRGSGGAFHALKIPSILATLVQHGGLQLIRPA